MPAPSTESCIVGIWSFEFVRQKSSWLICLLSTQDGLQILCEWSRTQLFKLSKIALCWTQQGGEVGLTKPKYLPPTTPMWKRESEELLRATVAWPQDTVFRTVIANPHFVLSLPVSVCPSKSVLVHLTTVYSYLQSALKFIRPFMNERPYSNQISLKSEDLV